MKLHVLKELQFIKEWFFMFTITITEATGVILLLTCKENVHMWWTGKDAERSSYKSTTSRFTWKDGIKASKLKSGQKVLDFNCITPEHKSVVLLMCQSDQ